MARKRKGVPIHGWLVIDKPPGMTSTQVMARVRRLLNAESGIGSIQAFDVSDLPPEIVGLGGLMGHNPKAAAAAWQEIQRFLPASR